MSVVPRLPLGGLTQEIPDDCAALITPGRASARTRNRALLRAKARARRREERDQQLNSARDSSVPGSETAREVATVWEDDEDEEPAPSLPKANSLQPKSSTMSCDMQSSPKELEDGDISGCSSEDDLASSDILPSALIAASCHAWEYPLSAAEKKERVMLIFGRTEALSERHIQRCERREERLRTQARLHRQDLERLRRERNDLCREAASLRNENRDLREKVRDLEKRSRQSDLQKESARIASSCSRSLPTSLPEDSRAPIEDLSPVMTSRGLSSARVSTPSCVATSMETPRMLSMVTPRNGAARVGMRGTVASVTWGEAYHVPWVAFTSRSTLYESLYGERDSSQIEESSLSLRRGEYIRSISGSWSTASTSEPVARSLRIVTSEHQETFAGEAMASPDFYFEADEDSEIVGLRIQDGRIIGVKQAMLAPSRVPSSAIGCLSTDIAIEVEAATSSLHRSMQALRRNSMARTREAVVPR